MIQIRRSQHFKILQNFSRESNGCIEEDDRKKFRFDGDITLEKIKDPIPEINDGNVKVVVGIFFDESVPNESKDALLEPYQLWNYGEYKYENLETSEDLLAFKEALNFCYTS